MMRRCLALFLATTLSCCTLVSLAQPATGPTPAAQPQGSGDWKHLKAHEKRALAPLATEWGQLTEVQRGKWLLIAQQFDQLPATEQQVMQQRMKSWVALSPAKRNQARLNFNLLQNLPKEEKKSRWDEYQSLSDDEKRKLSAGALGPARTAAPSRTPSSAERLVQPPLRTMPPEALPSRQPIDRRTLLPVPAAPVIQPAAPASMPPASTEPADEGSDS